MSKLSLSVQPKQGAVVRGQATKTETTENLSDVRPVDPLRTDLQVLPSLAECEQVIERGRQTFREVGQALTFIRDGRLYLETHRTFEAYCRDRWGMSRPRAYQLIAAAVSTTVDNEWQARRLRVVKQEEPIDPADAHLWDRLIDVMDVIEALSSSDALRVAATVPDRRRAATAQRLRKLGTYLGRIAWSLESEGEPQ